MHFVGHDQHHGFDSRIALDTDYTREHDPLEYRLAYDWGQPSGGNPAGPEWMGPSYVDSPQWDPYPKHFEADERIHREAIEYLSGKEPGGRPFLCCISYHQPHNPFWIPGEIREMFAGGELPLPEVPPGVDPCQGPMDRWLDEFHYLPQVRREMMTRENLRWLYETYYGMIHDVDRRIGEVLDLVSERGLDRDTAVVFASDHGDMLGHRGMLQKRYFYERSVRAALVFSYPGRWAEGARLSTQVSLVDIFPTLADLGEAPVPDGLPGQSLVDSLEGGTEPENRTVLCEYHGEGVHAPCFMAVRDGFKYMYVHGYEERLYHLPSDPDEYANLIDLAEHGEVAEHLRKEILDTFDPDQVASAAVRSQRNRNFIYECAKRKTGRDFAVG
jgi:choline-sulfatase